jgi:hypothetical protein
MEGGDKEKRIPIRFSFGVDLAHQLNLIGLGVLNSFSFKRNMNQIKLLNESFYFGNMSKTEGGS